MKDKFIRFLKDHQAFKEYEVEIEESLIGELFSSILERIDKEEESISDLFADGYNFYYEDAVTDVDWKNLNYRWVELLNKEGYFETNKKA